MCVWRTRAVHIRVLPPLQVRGYSALCIFLPCGRVAALHTMRVPLLSCLLVLLPCQATHVVVCRRPKAAEVVSFLNSQASIDNQPNHNFAGATERLLDHDTKHQLPDHMKLILLKADLGTGRSVYERAQVHLLNWNLHAGSQSAGIVTKPDAHGRPAYLATFAKTFGGLAWCLNPCRVQYRLIDKPYQAAARATVSGLQTATAYCTLRGHLFEGEERVRVVWEKRSNNAVWFEVLSVSRGHGILGKLIFPLMASTQLRFFQEQVDTMQRLCSS
jgi:uncharacterized protein (UPF0548 family)